MPNIETIYKNPDEVFEAIHNEDIEPKEGARHLENLRRFRMNRVGRFFYDLGDKKIINPMRIDMWGPKLLEAMVGLLHGKK